MQFFGIPGFQTLQRIGQHLATVLQTNIWITLLQCYTLMEAHQVLKRCKGSGHHVSPIHSSLGVLDPQTINCAIHLEHQVFNCYKPPTCRADKGWGMGGPGGS